MSETILTSVNIPYDGFRSFCICVKWYYCSFVQGWGGGVTVYFLMHRDAKRTPVKINYYCFVLSCKRWTSEVQHDL